MECQPAKRKGRVRHTDRERMGYGVGFIELDPAKKYQ